MRLLDLLAKIFSLSNTIGNNQIETTGLVVVKAKQPLEMLSLQFRSITIRVLLQFSCLKNPIQTIEIMR